MHLRLYGPLLLQLYLQG
ncbi:unnamed protein product [Victoria cruziana]